MSFERLLTIAVWSFAVCMWGQPAESEATSRDLTALSLEELINVEVHAAAMHSQQSKDAPGNITVITREEIVLHGYRTLGDVLAYVRGFYVTDDRSYLYPGLRGFNLPGDFSTRFLVLINGHNIVSNVDNTVSAFGQDFPLDLSLVQQIEVIRGPSSALYGTNGILCTINVVTISPEAAPSVMVRADTGSYGTKKLQLAGAAKVGGGALMLSASVLNNSGREEIYIPELDSPDTNHGIARHMDNERGYHLFANFVSGRWNVLAVAGFRQKIQPVSWGDTVFNDRGTRTNDSRNFVEGQYTRERVHGGTLTWRLYYDGYRFTGLYRYPANDGGVLDSREWDTGNWLGSQVAWRSGALPVGRFTAGAEVRTEIRSQIRFEDVPSTEPGFFLDRPDQAIATFIQDEISLGKHVKVTGGARFDVSRNHSQFVSPRVALVFQPTTKTTYKMLYGRSFRNPSVYEMYFDDGGATRVANPQARPERSNSFEAMAEHQFSKRLQASFSAYSNVLSDSLVVEYTPEGAQQFRNVGRYRSLGLEAELQGRFADGYELDVSLSAQRAIDTVSRQILLNSPVELGMMRLSGPFISREFPLSFGARYMSARQTLSGTPVSPVVLADVNLVSARSSAGIMLNAGVHNLFDRRYADPVGLTPKVPTMPAAGRSFFLTISWDREPKDAVKEHR